MSLYFDVTKHMFKNSYTSIHDLLHDIYCPITSLPSFAMATLPQTKQIPMLFDSIEGAFIYFSIYYYVY